MNYFNEAIELLEYIDKIPEYVKDEIISKLKAYESHNLKRYGDKERAVDLYALKEFLNYYRVAVDVFGIYKDDLYYYRKFIELCYINIK